MVQASSEEIVHSSVFIMNIVQPCLRAAFCIGNLKTNKQANQNKTGLKDWI